MIDTTLENIRKYLEYKFKEAGMHDWNVILNALDKDGNMKNALYITLLRIEEETSRKKQSRLHRIDKEHAYYATPDLCVNLFILISSHTEDYSTGLMQISTTMSILNTIQDFAYVDEKGGREKDTDPKTKVYEAVKQLSIELQTLTAEQNNSLWQTLGCKVMPAVCYKIRMLTISNETNKVDAPPIKEVIDNLEYINH